MTVLTSESARVQFALRDEIVALAEEGLRETEVQAREDYFFGDVPFEGVTVHDIGEQYSDGVIGLHDVGYRLAVTLVSAKTGDALLVTDWLLCWREAIRRRFQDQRLPVGEADGIRHHNTKVVAGQPANANKFPNHRIHQVVIVVWNRESKTTPRVR
jgi:hypothetical protein